MRVHDSSLNSVTIASANTGRAEAASSERSATQARSVSGEDQLSLSDLGSLVRALSADTPEHTARVSQLAAAYRSGNYRPDAKATAKALVNDAFPGA
jgi:anti-sigma28 factor (negative regulator of flagellin synthesis)